MEDRNFFVKISLRMFLLLDLSRMLLYYFTYFLKNLKKVSNINGLSGLQGIQGNSKKVLFISLTDTPFSIKIEGLLAAQLNRRGYTPYFFTNFGFHSGVKTYKNLNGIIIGQLRWYLRYFFILFKFLPIVPKDELSLKRYQYAGIPLGLCVYSSVCSKIHSGNIDFSKREIRKLVERYFYRSIIYFESARGIINKIKPDLVIANEKGYSGNYEPFQAAIEQNIPFIQWVGCQEPGTLVFKRYSKDNERQHPNSLSKDSWNKIVAMPWEEKIREEVLNFFEQGYVNKTWFSYKRLIVDANLITKPEFERRFQLDPNKKMAVLFSHIMWDANLFYGEDLFPNGFEEWFVESARAMLNNSEVNWLIKVHPANKFKHETEKIKGDYRELQVLRSAFGGVIPDNIKIILPEDNINPFALFKMIDYGITVRGTVGVELPCFAVPVLTAGTGRYSNLGFTIDSDKKADYLIKLSKIQQIPRLTEEQQRLACKHAYSLFRFRPFLFSSVLESNNAPGQQRDLNIIENNINKRKDFETIVEWAINSKQEDLLISR